MLNDERFYNLLNSIFSNSFKYLLKWEVRGQENIPSKGPVIVAANHLSNWDPPVLGSALNRRVYFVAKKELFEVPIFGKILDYIGTIPIKRGKPDRRAIRSALDILKSDQMLCLFPEGTRSEPGKLRRAKLGIVMIALKSKAPILPLGLINTNQLFKEKLEVRIGKPFTLDQYYDKKLDKSQMRDAGARIMGEIANLLE